MPVLRTLLKLFLYSLAVVVLGLALGVLWLVYYSRDLPDFNALAQFAPTTTTEVSGACLEGHSIAIPFASIGKNLTNALNAAEVDENDPGVSCIHRPAVSPPSDFVRSGQPYAVLHTF